MPDDAARYPRYRFPPEIISHPIWLYYRFNLSFRDVEDILPGIVKLRKFRSTETPDIVVRQDEGRDAMRTGLGRKPAT
jgi:hypothetical protein